MNETDATAIFAPLWRRKWLILGVAILVAAGSYVYYKGQTKTFQSSTQIYLGGASEEGVGAEKVGRSSSESSTNQVAVINAIIVPQVRKLLRQAGERGPAKGEVKAKSAEKSQFLTITAEGHTPKSAARLANAVALAYLRRQHADRRRGINTAIEIARRQLRRIELSSATPKAGSKSSANGTSNVLQQAALSSKINQLEASAVVTGAQQVAPARPAAARLLKPKPRQNAIFGFVIGLLLASILAYALGRFDRRLRTLSSVESIFGAQIVTALPTVRRPIVVRDGARAPSKNLLEPIRRLHAALLLRPMTPPPQNANGAPMPEKRSPRVILITSADVGDGKSTVLADLALVQRDSGARVAVVDANMRRPAMARLLGVEQAQRLAEVLNGRIDLAEAMETVDPGPSQDEQAATAGGGAATLVAQSPGSLSVLASGDDGANPPALLASESMPHLISALSDDYDFVLIDGPSPLQVSDVMPLLSLVDGVLVVLRLGHTRDAYAERLAQLLNDDAKAPLLGVVANCVPPRQIERYGFASTNPAGWTRVLQRR